MCENDPQLNRVPVVTGFIEDHDQGRSLRVWCSWCCRWHEHGYTGTQVGDTTDRAAHCYAPDSPYKETGYNILVSGTPFPSVAKTMRKATVAQERAIRAGQINEKVQQLRDQPLPAT